LTKTKVVIVPRRTPGPRRFRIDMSVDGGRTWGPVLVMGGSLKSASQTAQTIQNNANGR